MKKQTKIKIKYALPWVIPLACLYASKYGLPSWLKTPFYFGVHLQCALLFYLFRQWLGLPPSIFLRELIEKALKKYWSGLLLGGIVTAQLYFMTDKIVRILAACWQNGPPQVWPWVYEYIWGLTIFLLGCASWNRFINKEDYGY